MGSPITRRTGALVLTAALGASAPAEAAPTLRADAPCYSEGDVIGFAGEGYSPGGRMQLSLTVRSESGSYSSDARFPTQIDDQGRIEERFLTPGLAHETDRRGEARFVARDQQRAAAGAPVEETTASTTVTISAFAVMLEAARVSPRGRWTLHAVGFTGSERLWAHYVHRGRRRARVALGAVRGPCGDLTKRMRQFPQSTVAPGTWDIYVSDSATIFRGEGASWIRVRVRVPGR